MLDPMTIIYILIGGQAGIIFGMMPGLTTTTALSLLTGLTFSLAPDKAIAVILAAYVGSVTGGSRSAILVNIPGTPAQAAVCLDGYPLAQQGKAAQAIGLSVTASTIGTLLGFICLALFTPLIGTAALSFGTYEFFWLAVFGVVIAGSLCAPKDPVKGWIAGFLGLVLMTVGDDSIHAIDRFTFNMSALGGGFALIPVLIGAYGIPEVLDSVRKKSHITVQSEVGRIVPRFGELLRHKWLILRSALIGIVIGIIPGVGSDTASWLSYFTAKENSKHPELFGKGSIEGFIAAETGDNACIGGDIIPTLTLAVPGSAPAAVLLAAMTIHNLRPGPLLVAEQPEVVGQIIAISMVSTMAVFALSLMWTRQMVKILLIPRYVLMPAIFIICVTGAYALSGRIFDIYVMFAFGLLGVLLNELDYPVAPLVLGFILGPMAEDNFRRGLMITAGDPSPFFTRPISLILFLMLVVSVLWSTSPGRWIGKRIMALWPKKKNPARR
ncbi:MAG: tripartite tricarboxylate transporter permease [Deltaproteobacteria bacterium]|nr:tripartite tricarboxylate transporter permease [Deltaproteobacteria bacterium]